MALKFLDGCGHWASGDLLKKWAASTTGNTIDATHGPLGGPCIRGSPVGSLWMSKSIGGSATTVIAGFWIKQTASQGAGTTNTVRFKEGSTVHATIGLDGSGFVRAYRGNGATLLGTAGSGAMVFDVGYYVQVKVTVHDTLGTVDVMVCQAGGTPTSVLSLTGQDTRNGGTGFCDTVDIFPGFGPVTNSNWGYLAELFIMDTSGSTNNAFLTEPWRVDALFPSADGTYLEWTPSTGSTHFDLADEATPNTTDYNSSNTTNQRDTYAIANLSALSTTIYAIQLCSAMAASAAGAVSAAGMIRSSGSDAVGTGTALSTTQAYLLDRWETDPATGIAWTESGVNALEAGGKVTSGGTPSARLSQSVVEVLRGTTAVASSNADKFFFLLSA